jgi:acetyl-CoA C-acetyltransferase
MSRQPVIVSGARTAVGEFGASLKDVRVTDLGALVIKEALKRANLRPLCDTLSESCRPNIFGKFDKTEINKKYYAFPDSAVPVSVDECIMGNVLIGGLGQNPARQAMIFAGLPEETTAFTVNKVCASGIKAIALAAQAIKAEDADIIVAGGMENMSQAPYAMPKARWGYRMDMPFGQVTDLMVFDGLYEIFNGYHMGNTAENIAEKYKISRQVQDEMGLLSHQRARAAIQAGKFKDEIVPVMVPQRKGDPIKFEVDERPMDTTIEKMAKLKPAFRKEGGTVTAGNASGINDAAAALVIMPEFKANDLSFEPIAKIKGYASAGVDPAYMGLGPIPATRKVLKKLGLRIEDIDLFELNEAFAVQAIADIKELGLSMDNTNVNGSGISIGHPIGATGARMIYTLALEMRRRDVHLGLATLCIGGGMGMAMVLER